MENETESGSVVMHASDELEDFERLANDIFDESEDQFHGFYEDQTVRDIFDDSDDESELFERFNVTSKCWTILKQLGKERIDLQFSIELFLKIM